MKSNGPGPLLRRFGGVICAFGVFLVLGNTASVLVGDFPMGYAGPVVIVALGITVFAIGEVVVRKKSKSTRH